MKKSTTVIAAASIIAFAGGGVTAYAAGQINSRDIANDSILSKDLKDDKAVGFRDLRPDLRAAIVGNSDGSIQPAVWRDGQPNDSSPVTITESAITVDLALEDTPPAGAGASAETNDLGVAVQAGDIITFELTLGEGVVCGAGGPRMFVEVNGNFINSFDGNDDACGGEDGVVTYSVPSNGRIGQAGFVNDSSPGEATFSNLTIDGQAVPFS